ncbi:hypothetical protein FQA39_LY01755 [Lamprigera yunnana]|nr:hypothetical protein FQA39_LY01755 [Lamprigera yunnana]
MPLNNTPPERYSSWVGLVYVFNLIVGTGALTLPAVFVQAGWLLSLILLITLAFVSFITVTFVVETIACANATKQWNRIQSHRVDGESEAFAGDSSDDNINENTAMINQTQSRYYSLSEKVELGEMTGLFFNRTGRILFYLCLCVYLYGDLAIYVTAISKTLCDIVCNSSQISNSDDYTLPCWDNTKIDKMSMYRVFILLFAVLVGPFSYFNVQKTKYLQILTSSMRWVAFTIMITIAVTEMSQYGPQGHPKMVNFVGTPALIGASIYSFMSHHSLPGLIAPFSKKRFIIRQLALDYFLICTFYILLALTGSFAFLQIFDLYTLNFVPSSLGISGVFMEMIEYYLGLFPVFTLSTSFPIIAITLQNNLKALFLDVNTLERYNFILRRLLFPTLTIIPPIVVCLFTHNLGKLVAFTGSFGGMTIQYIFPVFLVRYARRYCAVNIGTIGSNQFASPFKRVCVVVLMGLPAAGKTTFVEMLKEITISKDNYVLHVISYDEIINNCRINFKLDRFAAKEHAKHTCENLINNETHKKHIVVIDDNMYFKSMRYEYYKLARDYGISFLQVYLRVNLVMAIERNNKRECKVLDDVIVRMANKFEEPREGWERHLEIDANVHFNDNTFQQFFIELEECFNNRIIKPTTKSNESVPLNKLQHIDLTLRKIVHIKINNDKTKALYFCNKRSDLYKRIKDGNLHVDNLDDEELFVFLQSLF